MQITKEELYRLYWEEGKSLCQIAKQFGIKRPETIRQLMIKYGISRRPLFVSNPNLNPSPALAYVIGVYFGDGSILKSKFSKTFRLECRNKEFVESLGKALKSINIKPKIWKHTRFMKKTHDYRTYWLCDGYSIKLCNFLESLTVSNLKKFIREKEEKKEFVRGFYESEGSFYASRKHGYRLKISNTSKEILEFIKECCESLEIKGWHLYEFKDKRNPNWSVIYDLVLRRKQIIQQFFSIINPVIKNPLL